MRQAILVVVGVALLVTVAHTQTRIGTVPAKASTLRTPWGDPDLQGVWNVAAGTPLERPPALAGKEFLTDDELAQAEKQIHERNSADRRDGAATDDVRREANEFWFEKRPTILTRRTSLIIDPPDGKLPPLTPTAAQKPVAKGNEFRSADGPEDRGLGERCIARESNGPPIVELPSINEHLIGFAFHFQIFQSANYVAILSETVQQVRIIPLDGRPHLPQSVRQWLGDSRGHWEGTTLVVETTNFHDKRLFLGLTVENMRVVERFTRGSADTLDYQFTIDDPTRWTKPWTAAVPIGKTDGPIYEFACQEGNYSMRNILSGARAQEKVAAQAEKTGSR